MDQKTTAHTWNSRIGFILASAGSAVGLGSIWKFPYMVGADGGAAFLIPYLFLSFTVGLSLLLSEYVIGRAGRADACTCLQKVVGKGWGIFGVVGILTSFTILCFYSAVGGWCLKYLFDAILGVGMVFDAATLQNNFGSYVSNGWLAALSQLGFLLMTGYIVLKGVNKGIERYSKILMPTLFLLMLVMIVRGLTLPGGLAGLEYLFTPHWDQFNSTALFNAMGLTFFSLSLGAGTMITYSSYLPQKTDLINSTAWVVLLTVFASLLGGMMIMPTVFAFHLDPSAGPGLTFVTMPAIFSQLPFGQFFAIIFYLCLLFAALTSSVSMFEPSIEFLRRRMGVERKHACVYIFVVQIFLGMLCSLSFGPLKDVKIFGKTFFDFFDFITSNIGMPTAAMAAAVGAAWFSWKSTERQLQTVRDLPLWALWCVRVLMGVISPILIVAVVIYTVSS